jgi:hypothetical protein
MGQTALLPLRRKWCSGFFITLKNPSTSVGIEPANLGSSGTCNAIFYVEYFVRYISTSRSTCAVPTMAVLCSSLFSCCIHMLLTYFLNDFEMIPVAPIITGITFVFAFYMRCISIARSLYFDIFAASFLITSLYTLPSHYHGL